MPKRLQKNLPRTRSTWFRARISPLQNQLEIYIENLRYSRQRTKIGIAIALLAVTSGGVWWQSTRPHIAGKQELDQVVGQVSKHIVLPTNETPTLATITDRSKLQANGFLYAKGRNGDKVLIYSRAGRAYIYRPSLGKIIDVGPVVVDESHNQARAATIVIEDSTRRPEVASKITAKLKSVYPEAAISTGPAAQRTDFPNTIVIDSSGQKAELIDGITATLGVQRGVLPLSEPKPTADIVVIVGQDFR